MTCRGEGGGGGGGDGLHDAWAPTEFCVRTLFKDVGVVGLPHCLCSLTLMLHCCCYCCFFPIATVMIKLFTK